jgi:hypothetical protein
MSKIKEFITNNNLSLEEGSRNSSLVCIIGYAQHLGLTEKELQEELDKEINEDSFIGEEIARLFDYCKLRKYKNYWLSPEAKSKYKF